MVGLHQQEKSSVGKVILVMLWVALASVSAAGEKHFIGHGWDLLKVTTDDLVRNLPELEKLSLDGISISLSEKRTGGRRAFTRNVLSDDSWSKEAYTGEIENIRIISSGKLKHNFLLTNFTPTKRLAWTDDAGWAKAAHNASVLAWIAKNSGVKGIMMDPEDYLRSKQFYLLPDDPPYSETVSLVRRRGGQIMKALAMEHPELVILSFWFLKGSLQEGDLSPEAARIGNLWIPFINGLLDELPPGFRMVDATERGYVCSAAHHEFYQLAWNVNRMARHFVAPENQVKFLRQYQFGFGLFLDMYTDAEDREWSHPATDNSRLATLVQDFSEAMACADQYCWIYGEHFSWIKWDCAEKLQKDPPRHMKISPETWEEKLPGFTKALTFIVNGKKAYQDAYDNLVKNGKLENLIRNSKCLPDVKAATDVKMSDWDTEALPPGWAFWRSNPEEGSVSLDTTVGMDDTFSVKATGTTNSSFLLSVNVKPGQIYSCEAFRKGCGTSTLKIRWMQDKKWLISVKYDISIPFAGTANERGWQRAFGFVKVPPDANKLVFLLSSGLQSDETVWYDNPCISLISPDALP